MDLCVGDTVSPWLRKCEYESKASCTKRLWPIGHPRASIPQCDLIQSVKTYKKKCSNGTHMEWKILLCRRVNYSILKKLFYKISLL